MVHKPWPDRHDGLQTNEPDTVRGIKQGMEAVRQGGPLGGGDIQAKTWMSSSWPCDDGREGRSRRRTPRVQRPPPPQEGEVWGVQEPERRLLG